jgi:hypothetical protein
MLKLFDYFTVAERIKLERVNKKFMEISYLVCGCGLARACRVQSWSRLSNLSLTADHLSTDGRVRALHSAWLVSIIRRCAPYLKTLDLSLTPHLLDDTALNVVGEQCMTLQEVQQICHSLGQSTVCR